MIQAALAAVFGAMLTLQTASVPQPRLWPWLRPLAGHRQVRFSGLKFVAMPDSADNASPKPDFSGLIVALAQRQDRAAFEVLFGHFAPRVKTYMVRGGASAAQADELAQETLLAVWRKAGQFDAARATAATWIFAIARNLRIDRLRKEWRDAATGDDLPEIADDAAGPDTEFSASQGASRVRAALKRLPADQVKVIEMSFFDEKAHGEIAATLGIPLGTVKSRIRIAMKRLRELLDDLS